MSQTRTPDAGRARQAERSRPRPSQRHLNPYQVFRKTIEIEPRERDEAAVIRLRENIARLVMELNGKTPHFTVSGDGYKVSRIGIGEAEMLLAVKERKDGTHVKYVYFNGLDSEPKAREFYFQQPRATAANKKASGIG